MSYRNLLAGAGIATVAMFAGSAAMAAPIDFGGYTGPITIDYNNYESFSASQTLVVNGHNVPAPAVNSDNFGIFTVSQAQANGVGPNILNQSTYVYVGVFDGVTTTEVDAAPIGSHGAGFAALTTGGTFDLYQIPIADINLTAVVSQGLAGYGLGGCSGPSLCYNGITNVSGGTLVLQWDFGTNSLNPTYSLTNPAGTVENTGSASGLAAVTNVGTDYMQFATDLSVEDDFCFNNDTGTGQCGRGLQNATNPANNWALLSHDPVEGIVTPVPEPASVALFGAGLLGFAGLFGWRRRKSA